MTETLHALFVDDEVRLRDQYIENLELALRDRCDIELTCETADRVEQGKKLLPRDQTRFGLVVVDLLWEPVGSGRYPLDARGLEVVEQAARTEGVVIVALSVGDTRYFPELEQDARAKGAHVFRLRSAFQAMSRSGGWEGLATDIAEARLRVRGVPRADGPPGSASRGVGERRSAFVVCGRDRRNDDLYAFLRAIGLAPREWEHLVAQATGEGEGGNPHVFDVIRVGFKLAYGAIVILSPDDEARLRSDCRPAGDPGDELELRGQPRQNVLLETGYALRHARDRTLIVTVGDVRLPSDLAGMHLLRLDNTAASRKGFADRLRAMGFAVDMVGRDWLTAGDFGPPVD